MEIQFHVNSNANIHSNKTSGWIDPVKEWGFTEGEWEKMSDSDKYKEAEQWAWEGGLEIGYEERSK